MTSPVYSTIWISPAPMWWVCPWEASRRYILACGMVTGIACLFSGWWQGVVCAAGIKSINQDKMGMGQAMLLAVFPEFYAILGLAFSALLLFQ